MTPFDVRERVENLAKHNGDEEVLHTLEDRLHQDVLKAIADGTCEDPAACAREALKSKDLDFSRWYA